MMMKSAIKVISLLLALMLTQSVAFAAALSHDERKEAEAFFTDVLERSRAEKRDRELREYKKMTPTQVAVPVANTAPLPSASVTAPTLAIPKEEVRSGNRAVENVVPRNAFGNTATAVANDKNIRNDPNIMIVDDGQRRQAISSKKGQWGSFNEASVWMGAWTNPRHNTGGVWTNLKYLRWYTKFEKPENFAIGVNVRADYGKVLKNGKADWGYIAPGPSVGYYRGLGLRNSFEVDGSLLYRIDKNRPNGFMPTGHVEFSRILDHKNRLTFQVDGNYFPNDSWLGPGIYWEHKIDKDWKVITGAGASLSWLDGDFFAGFQPSIRVKYMNRWNLGFNANLFTPFGPFYGIVAAYELTPDIKTWYESYKKGTITKKPNPHALDAGESLPPITVGDTLVPLTQEEGVQPFVPEKTVSEKREIAAIVITDKTIEEMENEKEAAR